MFAAASNIDTKMPATMKAINRVITAGSIGELTGLADKVHSIRKIVLTVVKTEIQSFAININTSAKPSTNANFAWFLRIRMKAFRAEEQKLSLEIAM